VEVIVEDPGRRRSHHVESGVSARRDRALRLLYDRHADAVPHLLGQLLDHLERTERLLMDWGSAPTLSTAGLCHACYGTDGFGFALLGLDEREVLTTAVGPDVEALVHLYASCDRGFFYPQIASGGPPVFRNRFTGESCSPSEAQLRDFVDLTLANEADVAVVGAPSPKAPEWSVSLVRQFGPYASRPVADACVRLAASS
jgi:hypothetical protein